MRRLTALLTVLSALALVAPAYADPVPEITEGGEAAGLTCGGSAGGSRQRPFHEIFGGNHYLSSAFSIGCDGFGGLTITRMHTDAKYGASGTGQSGDWYQFSRGISERGRSSEGTLSYSPLRNDCHVNGAWRFYRQTVDLTVNYTVNGNGGTRHETYYLATVNRLQCGANE